MLNPKIISIFVQYVYIFWKFHTFIMMITMLLWIRPANNQIALIPPVTAVVHFGANLIQIPFIGLLAAFMLSAWDGRGTLGYGFEPSAGTSINEILRYYFGKEP
jgi:hypothetical protein